MATANWNDVTQLALVSEFMNSSVFERIESEIIERNDKARSVIYECVILLNRTLKDLGLTSSGYTIVKLQEATKLIAKATKIMNDEDEEQVTNLQTLEPQNFNRKATILNANASEIMSDEDEEETTNFLTLGSQNFNRKNEEMTVSETESRPTKRGQEGQYKQTKNSLRLDAGTMTQIVIGRIPVTQYQSVQELRREPSGRSGLQENSGGATLTQAEVSQHNPSEHCSICLQPIYKKSFTNSCIHSFCFGCIKQWSQVKAECPLCKCVFTGIIYNIRADDSYSIFKV